MTLLMCDFLEPNLYRHITPLYYHIDILTLELVLLHLEKNWKLGVSTIIDTLRPQLTPGLI